MRQPTNNVLLVGGERQQRCRLASIRSHVSIDRGHYPPSHFIWAQLKPFVLAGWGRERLGMQRCLHSTEHQGQHPSLPLAMGWDTGSSCQI
eukprot:365263-Chlamydomonas_euryale.AAC.6